MAMLLRKILQNLSSARNLRKIHVGVVAQTHRLHEVKCFGTSKTLNTIGRYKTFQPEPSDQRACRIRLENSTFLDLSILLTAIKTYSITQTCAVVLTVYPSGDTECQEQTYQEAHKIFIQTPQLASTITEVVVVDPSHIGHDTSSRHRVPSRSLINLLHTTTSICFAGSPNSACFDVHEPLDELPLRLTAGELEARRRHRVMGEDMCQGCLKVAPALAAINLPSLEKLTLSRIHLADGYKLVDFSARHKARLKEMVVKQCMLSEAYASWE